MQQHADTSAATVSPSADESPFTAEGLPRTLWWDDPAPPCA